MHKGVGRFFLILFRVFLLLLTAATGVVLYSVLFGLALPAEAASFAGFIRADSSMRTMLYAAFAVEVILLVLSFVSGGRKDSGKEISAVKREEKGELKHVGSSSGKDETAPLDFPYAEGGIEPNFAGSLRFPFFRPLPTFKKLVSDAVLPDSDEEVLSENWKSSEVNDTIQELIPEADVEKSEPSENYLCDESFRTGRISEIPSCPVAEEDVADVDADEADYEAEAEAEPVAAGEENPVEKPRATHSEHSIAGGEGETFVADLDMVHGVGGLANHTGVVRRYNYKPPLPTILKDYPTLSRTASEEERAQGAGLVEFLKSFKVLCTLEDIVRGPAVIMYELQPALGVKSATIASMAPDIARYFKVSTVRVVTTMQGKNTIGVEVQSTTKETVGFRSLLSSVLNKNTMKVPFILGKDLLGSPVSLDIYKAPHVLIAGSTGSGKSVCINSLIASILYTKTPSEVRLILVDPKQVELSMYSNIPHLLTPVITDSKRVIKMLDFCIVEMERRYKMISSMSVRNIEAYNEKIRQQSIKREFLPYIVVVLDEFGDIVTAVGKEFEIRVQRLAAKARAAGIHLVLATQRPSVDVITGTIKTNIPCRIAFRVASGTDSRTIIDAGGAETLLGSGDMLYKSSTGETKRVQGSFLSDQEVEDLSNYCHRLGEPDFIDESFFEEDEDPVDADLADDPAHMSDEEYYSAALKILYKDGEISTSFLQRKLNIGYNKAAKLVDRMDEEGLIGPGSGNKRRQLIKPLE